MIRTLISDIRQGLLNIVEEESDIRIDDILKDVNTLEEQLDERASQLNQTISELNEIKI